MLTAEGQSTTHDPFCFCPKCRGEANPEQPSNQHADLVERGYKVDTDLAGRSYYFCRTCGTEIDMSTVALPDHSKPGKITSLPASPKSQFSPWLKPKDIKKKGTTKLTLTGVMRPVSSAYGEGIAIEVTNGTKKKFDLNVKFNSGNYGRLFDQFGKNPAKWKGAITVQVAQHMGKDYVQVV